MARAGERCPRGQPRRARRDHEVPLPPPTGRRSAGAPGGAEAEGRPPPPRGAGRPGSPEGREQAERETAASNYWSSTTNANNPNNAWNVNFDNGNVNNDNKNNTKHIRAVRGGS